MDKALIILAPGGLGNQFFAVAASLHLGEALGVKIVIFSENNELVEKFREVQAELQYPVTISMTLSSRRNLLINRISGKAHKLILNFPFATKFIKTKFRTIHNPWEFPFDLLSQVGKPPWVLRGFFQDIKLINSLSSSNRTFVLKMLDADSVRDFSSLGGYQDSIGVHVRRGDYASIPDYGILTRSYFQEIIQGVRKDHSKVIITSDDAEILPGFKSMGNEELLFPDIYSPLQSMIELAKTQTFVMSNSTFSFWIAWAVFLGGGTVYTPEPWFRKSEVPTNFLSLDGFIKKTSKFEVEVNEK